MSLRSRRVFVRRTGARPLWALLFGVTISLALFGQWGGALAIAGDAAQFCVIVDPESSTAGITREMLADAFLKATTRWPNGETIRPIDQRPDSPTRKAFSDGILKRSVLAVRSYWQQRIFSGRAVPPPEFESDEAVVRYVSEHRGAVGYVSSAAKIGNTKVINVQ
jgi:ABC-type phosphate transport system substrate-binding protein